MSTSCLLYHGQDLISFQNSALKDDDKDDGKGDDALLLPRRRNSAQTIAL
jgi:hypothetical protein